MDKQASQWTPASLQQTDDRLTASAAADALGVSQRTVRRAIARGDLPATKRDGVFEIAAADLEHYRARRRKSTHHTIQPLRALTRLTPLSAPVTEASPALPQFLTSLIGRECEIATLTTLLRRDRVRLLTLTGPAGVGKTRLAVATGRETSAEFPDGVYFVPLAPIRDANLVPAAIAAALGVREIRGRQIVARVQRFLGDRRVLILLDNVEHVLDGAMVVTDLLTACPRLTVLATSRAGLHLSGERLFAVSPLALPDPRHLPPLANLAEVAAVRLFLERSSAVRDNVELTMDNAPVIAEICSRLDGLPLAIELAAARSRVLSPAMLLTHLAPGLPILTGGPRDAPARHWTMREAIAWSHDLLTPQERIIFRSLAVFVGGCTLEAAQSIAEGQEDGGTGARSSVSPSPSVLDGLTSLAEKSLLRVVEATVAAPIAQARFEMLETIREFALDQLVASGEAETVRRRHAGYLVRLAETAEPLLRGPDQVAWLERLEAELPNIRAALAWLQTSTDIEGGLRLAASLWTFWVVRDHVPEGRRWLETFLALASGPSELRLKTLIAVGDMAERQGDYGAATILTEEALALARMSGDRVAEAAALRGLGNIALARGEGALHDQDSKARAESEFARARTLLSQSVTLAGDAGDEWGEAKALHWLSIAVSLASDPIDSAAILEKAVSAFRRLGDRRQLCSVLWNEADLAVQMGDLPRARTAFGESLALSRQLRYLWLSGLCMLGLATLAAERGEGERTARMLGAAMALREAAGQPIRAGIQAKQDGAAVAAKALVGNAVFSAAWAAGNASPADEAIDEALDWVGSLQEQPAEPTPAPVHVGLTPRERDVLRLLSEGHSDKEIAAALFVSRRTVAGHVSSILRKLGLTARAAAAAYAVRHGLA